MSDNLQEMLNAFKKAQANGILDPKLPEGLAKELLAKSTFTQNGSATSGLTFYDLEAGAKFLYPVLTPLRNSIPRVSGKGGIQANWRAVTAINTAGLDIGVSIGNRNAVQAVATQDYTASYKGIGIETNVDFEAQYAGMGFDDIRAIAAKTGLESLMIGEEKRILGGNTSNGLGQTPNAVLATATTGGALPATTTYSVIVIALSYDAVQTGSVVNGVNGLITRTNTDGSTDTFGGGAAKKSSSVTIETGAGSANLITATVAPVVGAAGYAWYWGAAGSEVLGAITTVNSVSIGAAAGGTQTAASMSSGTDYSTNSLAFDGLLTQALKSGSGAYVSYQATGTAGVGTPLTADNTGGVVEIDAAFKSMWDNYRLGPDTIWVNSQEALNISKKILQGGTQDSNLKFFIAAQQGAMGGGVMIKQYLNRFSMGAAQAVDIKIHPYMPAGMILMTANTLPYPLSNVSNVMQVRTRQDYYQIEWPLRSRRYEYGVYADEVLQHYFPPAMAVIGNIGNG